MNIKPPQFIACIAIVLVALAAFIGPFNANQGVKNEVVQTQPPLDELGIALASKDFESLAHLLEQNQKLLFSLQNNALRILKQEGTNADLFELNMVLDVFNQLKLLNGDLLRHPQVSSFFADSSPLTQPLRTYLLSNKGNQSKTLEKEKVLASAVMFLALNQEQAELVEHEQTKPLVWSDWYQDEEARRSPHRVLEKALLHALWIEQSMSIEYVKNPEQVFINIKGLLDMQSDVVRLLKHENEQVVLVAAYLINELVIKNAVTSLRFQLTQKRSEDVLFALLDALSVYGEQAEEFEPQLRSMQRITDNSNLRQKIQQTINRLHGRSV